MQKSIKLKYILNHKAFQCFSLLLFIFSFPLSTFHFTLSTALPAHCLLQAVTANFFC